MPRNISSYRPHQIDVCAPGRRTDRGAKTRLPGRSRKSEKRKISARAKTVLSIKPKTGRKLRTFLRGKKPWERIIVKEIMAYFENPRQLNLTQAASAIFSVRLAPKEIRTSFIHGMSKNKVSVPLSEYKVLQVLRGLVAAEIIENPRER
jgi:hypothetical protein